MPKKHFNYHGELPVEMQTDQEKQHTLVVIRFGESDITLRFISVEHMMTFIQQLLDQGAKTWPDDPWMKEYLEP